MATDAFGWDDVFTTGEVRKDITELEAVACALCGWATCMAGGAPPKKFGYGMAALQVKFPHIKMHDTDWLMKYVDENKEVSQ